MKKLITILFVTINVCFSQNLKSVATKPFNIDWQQKVTDILLEKALGAPDTMNILQKIENVNYIYSNGINCYFIIKEDGFILYSIEMTAGEYQGIKTGMSKRKVIKYFGQPDERISSKNMTIMDWNYGEKYIITAKFQKGKLYNLSINKNI